MSVNYVQPSSLALHFLFIGGCQDSKAVHVSSQPRNSERQDELEVPSEGRLIPLSSSNDISSSDPHVAKVICGRVSTEISDKVIFPFNPTICHLGYAPTCRRGKCQTSGKLSWFSSISRQVCHFINTATTIVLIELPPVKKIILRFRLIIWKTINGW